MKNEMNIRQLREAAHQHKYEVVKGDSCTYCGTKVNAVGQGSAGDHVPPLAVIDANLGIPVGDMKIVPCCSECNTKLAAMNFATVDLRRSHIINSRPYLGKSEAQIIAQALYNANINEGFKRGEGQVDTPDVLAERILDKLPLLGSLCDPACGDGSFVRMQIKRLIAAGVERDWIEDNIRGYDIDVEMVGEAIRRLRNEFPGLNGKVIFKQKDIFEMKEHFNTIIMNPPFGIKGEAKHKNLWKSFILRAMELSESVVCVAPIRIRGWAFSDLMSTERQKVGKGCVSVLLDEVKFAGVDAPCSVVQWTKSADDVVVINNARAARNKNRVDGEFFLADIVSDKLKDGYPRWARADGKIVGCNPTAYKSMFGSGNFGTVYLRNDHKHELCWGELPGKQSVVFVGEKAEWDKLCAFLNDKANAQFLLSIAVMHGKGMLGIALSTLNAAFSSRHQK